MGKKKKISFFILLINSKEAINNWYLFMTFDPKPDGAEATMCHLYPLHPYHSNQSHIISKYQHPHTFT